MWEQAITCIVENGNIYKLEFGQKICIGVTAEIFTDLKNSAEKALTRNEELATEKDKYYSMLIEHGIIQKPKTTEDKILEIENSQQQIIKLLESLNNNMVNTTKRLEVLEDGYKKFDEYSIKNGDRTGQNKSSSANIK